MSAVVAAEVFRSTACGHFPASHPEALWELTWLYQLWCRAYLTKRPAPKDAADWHDRWAPGVLRRLGQVMARCDASCQSQHDLPALVESR